MIKKFEEFVNENYGSKYRRGTLTSRDLDKLERIFIDEFGLKKEMVRLKEMMVRMQMVNGIYTFEEITEILYKIKSVLKTSNYTFKDYAFVLIKHLFDESLSVKEREEVLNDFCETYKLELPIVFDINGKMITGEVYYCEELDAYAKDEDDFEEPANEWLCRLADEEGVLDDDQPDWVSNHWEDLNIYKVDLDKEFGWTEK
jgi:hypothetical protein